MFIGSPLSAIAKNRLKLPGPAIENPEFYNTQWGIFLLFFEDLFTQNRGVGNIVTNFCVADLFGQLLW
jgi:hypothetical protein